MGTGERLEERMATLVRRSVARISYMAQDLADLSVAARVASQYMADPREGLVGYLKRVIRYPKSHPRYIQHFPLHCSDETLVVWTESDWAGDQENRRYCSGRCIMLSSSPLGHWSKTQSNVALSSGEAELNVAVKGVSEAFGFWNFVKELFGNELQINWTVDSSAVV